MAEVAYAQKFPVTTGAPDPLILGTSEAPAFEIGAPTTSVLIEQRSDTGSTVISRSFDDATPTYLSFHRTRGTPSVPAPSHANDFVGEIRFGYVHPGFNGAAASLSYGATIDAFAGYGPQGQYGWGAVSHHSGRLECAAHHPCAATERPGRY